MKAVFISLLTVIIHLASFSQSNNPGTDGLHGLSNEQKEKLSKGEIIVGITDGKNEEVNKGYIEAAIIFNTTPEATWELLSKTEDQPLYLDECKEIKVISKKPDSAVEVHTAGNWLINLVYGVIEYFDSANYSLHWTLDSSYPNNGLDEMNGYWQLYPYGKDQTLGRYGNIVSLKNVPGFIENMFKKGGVKSAMASIKKYIDSGGTYRK